MVAERTKLRHGVVQLAGALQRSPRAKGRGPPGGAGNDTWEELEQVFGPVLREEAGKASGQHRLLGVKNPVMAWDSRILDAVSRVRHVKATRKHGAMVTNVRGPVIFPFVLFAGIPGICREICLITGVRSGSGDSPQG